LKVGEYLAHTPWALLLGQLPPVVKGRLKKKYKQEPDFSERMNTERSPYMNSRTMRILISTGHLGTAPSKPESFHRGMATKPDVVVADGGSADTGPVFLGEDSSMGLFEREEVELLLVASRKQGIPLIIGSVGDTGSNSRVDLFVNMVKELAEQHRIPKFKLGYFYSEVPKEYLRQKMRNGVVIEGLGGFPPLTLDDLEQTTRIVALAGVHPFIKLLDMGADVIMGGRCGDICIIAAPAIRAGLPEGLAYHTGKMIECASFCAEPYMGKETIIGTVSDENIKITPYHPGQRCTIASAAGHSMYERANPFFEYAVGGKLDMRECNFEQFDERTCRITGAKWVPTKEIRVKLEGARKLGERYMGIAGIRDPYLVQRIDDVIRWCRDSVEGQFGKDGYQVHFHIFGKNGVLKEMEPVKEIRSHELCIVVEGVAPDEDLAMRVTDFALRMMFLARIPGVKGTAGTAATTKRAMRASPGYIWSVQHTVVVDDPIELFSVHLTEAGV
jgi:hypothetical protein